ncbi:MAG: peptidase domain-containing ABC transporter [Cyclobacteriaceae bacterium]|nr:peptidase domain-containing ABC transporter [Cyclobacteriaceae bacterium]
MPDNRVIERTHLRQHDQSDCGVACLLSVIKYHGGHHSLEQLRKLSGTSRQGTTLLGLLQAAQQLGFDAEGLEAETVYNLSEVSDPAILHVVIDNRLQHYVVYYPDASQSFSANRQAKLKIGDPARGILDLSPEELDGIWKSKALLKLVPNEKFEKVTLQKAKKRQWIFSLVREDLSILTISMVLGLLIAMLGISSAIFSQKLIDDILPNENYEKLILSVILVTLLLLARSGVGFLRGLFMIRQGVDFNNRIIQSFYNSLLRLPKSFFDTRKTGDLIARMNDTRRIQSVLAVLFGSVSIDVLVVIVSLIFVFVYSTAIGLIMLGCLPVFALLLIRFNQPVIRSQKEVMAGYAYAESNFIDTIQGVADIKLANKLEFFERLNAAVYGFFQTRMADLGKLQIRFSVLSEVMGVIFMMTVFGMSSWLVISKQLQIGELVALLGIAGGIIPAVNRLMVSNIQIQEALVAFERMYEFVSMDKEDERAIDHKLSFDSLAVNNVSFRFPGRKQILQDVSFEVKRGEMIALVGESGRGKSTLLQLLQKFYDPEGGSISIDGLRYADLDLRELRTNISAIPQDPKIFNGHLLFNVVLNDDVIELQRAAQFLDQSGFNIFFADFPQGYLTLLGEEGVNLSGGQKQLVALARALFRQPKVLLLDESMSAMDRNTEAFVVRLLEKAKQDRITVLVTHRMATAQRCDRVYILENGKIQLKGTPEQLRSFSNFYSEGLQVVR